MLTAFIQSSDIVCVLALMLRIEMKLIALLAALKISSIPTRNIILKLIFVFMVNTSFRYVYIAWNFRRNKWKFCV